MDVVPHAGVAEVAAVAESVSIQITTHLWQTWAGIAIDRARVARSARGEAVRADDSSEMSDWMRQEFDASLVAVAASAHALDAIYGSMVVPQNFRDQWGKRGGPNRQGKIREALKLVFQTGPVNTVWVTEFDWLFDLRDAAVHAAEEPKSPAAHPLGTHTAPEYVHYSTESADKAVKLLLSVLRRCVDHPRSARPDAVRWAAVNQTVVAGLESKWGQPW